jgi:NTE family protein
MALDSETVPEEVRRAVIESRLPVHEWPDRSLVIAAVDAMPGELARFDRNSGVPLVDAVTASCAVPGVWPPATIGGRRYIDGGTRSLPTPTWPLGTTAYSCLCYGAAGPVPRRARG